MNNKQHLVNCVVLVTYLKIRSLSNIKSTNHDPKLPHRCLSFYF